MSGVSRSRFDLSLPVRGVSAPAALDVASAADRLGWRGIWLSELFGLDALVMLGAIAARTEAVRLGTAAVPATTRSAAVLAMAASSVAQLAPGRVVLGIGPSTPAVVDDRHDRPLRKPVEEISGLIDVIRAAVRGEVVEHDRSPRVTSLRIEAAAESPRLFLAALGPALTKMALTRCDGLLLNMVPFPVAVSRVAAAREVAGDAFETALLVRTCVDPSEEDLACLRREVAGYLRIGTYGRALTDMGVDISPIVSASTTADAARQIDDEMLASYVALGDAESCRATLTGLEKSGVSVLVVPPTPLDRMLDVVERLAPLL